MDDPGLVSGLQRLRAVLLFEAVDLGDARVVEAGQENLRLPLEPGETVGG